jgi:hypothetical protein
VTVVIECVDQVTLNVSGSVERNASTPRTTTGSSRKTAM